MPARPRRVEESAAVTTDTGGTTADAQRFASILGATPQVARSVTLPVSHRHCRVPVLSRIEATWPPEREIPQWFHTVPNKVPLLFRGSLLYPELIVLRLLEDSGWSGVWVKNWGGRAFWTDISVLRDLPDSVQSLFDDLETRVRVYQGGTGGCWDILAWKDSEFALIELKQRKGSSREPLKRNQLLWLEAALESGTPTSVFIVEYETS